MTFGREGIDVQYLGLAYAVISQLFILINARSFSRNYKEFNILLHSIHLLIILTITWFTVDTCADSFGYKTHHVYREIRKWGGVSIYVRNALMSNSVNK